MTQPLQRAQVGATERIERVLALDTLVIGNGPSGLCMSMALSGWWPYYRPGGGSKRLHRCLQRTVPGSFLRTAWPDVCAGLTGRSLNPVSLLFDTLMHPDPDNLARRQPSQIVLRRTGPNLAHRVVGSGPVGGAWNRLPVDMTCLSPGRWMELPPTELMEPDLPAYRFPAGKVLASFQAYAAVHGLQERCLDGRVVALKRSRRDGFKVLFTRPGGVEPELAVARRVVLATGMFDLPLRLGVSGEDQARVFHRAVEEPGASVLVVGAGLSAADAIATYLREGRRVLHSFRSYTKLSAYAGEGGYYPDYAALYHLMTGRAGHSLYTPFAQSRLEGIEADGTCLIRDAQGELRCPRVDAVVILIGSTPDLAFLPGDIQRRLGPASRVRIDPYTFETPVKGLYALGPLMGDNFVRFQIGGAWGALRHIAEQSDVVLDLARSL